MSDNKPLFEIADTIPLTGLGYDEGSEAKVNLNLTRNWQLAWRAIFEAERNKDETPTAFAKRLYAPQYGLAAKVVKSITIKQGTTVWERKTVTAADLQEMDETIDERLLDLIVSEIQERNAARAVHAKYPFRADRERLLARREKDGNQTTNGSDKSPEPDTAH